MKTGNDDERKPVIQTMMITVITHKLAKERIPLLRAGRQARRHRCQITSIAAKAYR